MKKNLLFTFIILCAVQLKAQYVGIYDVNEGNCDFFVKDRNWPEVVKCFSELWENDTSSKEYKYKLAKGYTYSNIDKSRGLALLLELEASNFSAEDFQEVLAQAYFFNYNFRKQRACSLTLRKTQRTPS